jgi:hypothetical protein
MASFDTNAPNAFELEALISTSAERDGTAAEIMPRHSDEHTFNTETVNRYALLSAYALLTCALFLGLSLCVYLSIRIVVSLQIELTRPDVNYGI